MGFDAGAGDRQKSKTELEMEAGRKAGKRHSTGAVPPKRPTVQSPPAHFH
jgi:hypothetical protein